MVVTTPLRMAMFLAQVLHESGCLKFTRELWGPTQAQKLYERDLQSRWAADLKPKERNYKAYQLGNEHPGDGKVFCGHGLIQITGRANHARCSHEVFGDGRLVTTPELLTTPENAVLSAFWFWSRNNLNILADKGDILACTKRINGGTNGLTERKRYYDKAIMVFKD
jgi:putative chitinase